MEPIPAKNISYQDSVYLVKLFHSSKSAENAEIGKIESSADSTSNQEVNYGNGHSPGDHLTKTANFVLGLSIFLLQI